MPTGNISLDHDQACKAKAQTPAHKRMLYDENGCRTIRPAQVIYWLQGAD